MKIPLTILLSACLTAHARDGNESFSFATRILPMLTKAGCNTGECHGAAIGRGGFRLSLLGYDPARDYLHITRELSARRIDQTRAEDSLLLRKPTKQTPHEGGRVFKAGSKTYLKLRDWISAGAPEGDVALTVASIRAEPAELRLPEPGRSASIRVTAVLSNGSAEDVTDQSLYDSDDEGLAFVDEAGKITLAARGVTSVMIRYGGHVTAVRVGAPFNPLSTTTSLPSRNYIDDRVAEQLSRWHLPASPVSKADVFFRRVHLDITGRLPEPEAVTSFLSLPDSPERRAETIDALLLRDAFTDWWTLKLADLLLINPKKQGPDGSLAYHKWLRAKIADNAPVDQIVHALLTADGDLATNGPANFHKLASDPRDMGEFVSRSFLGMRVACARCHNHPFDRWSMEDYHDFAAFFAHTVVENNRVITKHRGEVLHPKDQRVALPRPLGALSPSPDTGLERRVVLADWLTSPANPWFARAFVNRVWKELLGHGIIDPVDDVRVTNPPSNPPLLDALVEDFIRHRFDLRHLVATITRSATYQLSSIPLEGNRADDRFFSHARLRPISAQALADAVTAVLGKPESFPGHPGLTWSTQLPDISIESMTLDVFGRCPRTDSCETGDSFGGGLTQALHLINSESINTRLREGAVRKLVQSRADNSEVIRELHLRALGRLPTHQELRRWQTKLSGDERVSYFEDLTWALMNSREFSFNH